MRNNEYLAAMLIKLVDQNGLAYLNDEPYKVYLELIRNKDVDRKTASMILYALINDVNSAVGSDSDPADVSRMIQERCSLNKKAAENLADIFLTLYSKENEKKWEKMKLEGLSRFLKGKFVCIWKGFAVWDEGNGTVDCHYQAEIVLSPGITFQTDKKLDQLLKKNPFMTKEAIHEYFEKDLCQYLDDEFEEYCTCDDYYQPVVEDFDIDYYVSEWCGKNGFELISCEGNGEDGGYEPRF